VRGKVAPALARLAHLLTEVAAGADPGEQVALVLDYYVPILRRLHPGDHPRRERDLEQFATIAGRYRATTMLLTDMALEPPTSSVGDVLAADAENEGLLTLSTIHSAKGLEWHTVFILWAAEGRFPSMYNVRDQADLEEERRLMYVAVTRAKDQLYVTYPVEIHDRGVGFLIGRPSRFIEDIGDELLEPVVLADSHLR